MTHWMQHAESPQYNLHFPDSEKNIHGLHFKGQIWKESNFFLKKQKQNAFKCIFMLIKGRILLHRIFYNITRVCFTILYHFVKTNAQLLS